MEKALSGLLMALGNANVISGGGMLHNALVTSPEQLVIDDETIRFLKRIVEPIAVDEETIGIDALMEGMARSGVMLAEEHTLKFMRQGKVLDCGLGQWTSYDRWERDGMPDLIDRAHRKVVDILAAHTVPPFEASVQRRIDQIVSEFGV
jgi:trimethylamine--corrinoid protein Co-methyltransferase